MPRIQPSISNVQFEFVKASASIRGPCAAQSEVYTIAFHVSSRGIPCRGRGKQLGLQVFHA